MDGTNWDQLIASAKMGSPTALQTLVLHWPSERSAEFIGVLVHHLTASRIPTVALAGDDRNRVELAIMALQGINSTFLRYERLPAHRGFIFTGLLLHITDILTWIRFVAHNAMSIYSSSSEKAKTAALVITMALMALLNSDPRLASVICDLEEEFSTILSVVTLEIPGSSSSTSEPLFITNFDHGCPTIQLLHSAFGRGKLTDGQRRKITGIPGYSDWLLKSLVMRFSLLDARFNSREAQFFERNARMILALLQNLNTDPTFFALFLKPDCLQSLATALRSLTLKAYRMGIPSPSFATATSTLWEMVILDGHPRTTLDHAILAPCTTLPTSLRPGTPWPTIKFVSGIPQNLASPGIQKWKEVRDDITYLAPSLKAAKMRRGWCDNLRSHTARLDAKGWTGRSSIVSSVERQPGIITDSWVTKSMRRFYIAAVERLFNKQWKIIQGITTPDDFMSLFIMEPHVLVIDTTRYPNEASRNRIPKYAFRPPRFKASPYFTARLEVFLDEAVSRPSPSIRFAEARFTFGNIELMVMVRLQQQFLGPGEDAEFRVTNGMIRIGSSNVDLTGLATLWNLVLAARV
ncbi:hypothetical protein CC1G_08908 [Coprinopsis cinerea okayama7|uniref:Uncharacterized protein n=1 Tax=Coprinopsis cinerea (strain Okayama-7 / 130 / ATCC MYA-4618 / FGSC 9003) TaxID=240176 RepID=A8P8A2_COPC7|nr:hypothetical protein CC1G_08908 [Coprinopsis cinerea okayama7\|eukprot:XP_001839529.2 hypothetical protein CC1G_08908 [Coprinopsis cinerea okayama7\